MADVPARDLRNNVSAVLRRVEAGEHLRVTVSGRPVAELVPLAGRPPSMAWETFIDGSQEWRADAGLTVELPDLLPETTCRRPSPMTGPGRTGRTDLALADMSVFIAVEGKRDLAGTPPRRIAVSVITVGELRLGVLVAADGPTRARRLETLSRAEALDPLPVDVRVARTWAVLRLALRDAGKRMPLNDSWIAATAIARGLPVASQDADYDDVPGLEVIRL